MDRAARPGRGLLAHAQVGGRLPDRAARPGRGPRRTPGREVGRWTGHCATVVACWRTPGREVGR